MRTGDQFVVSMEGHEIGMATIEAVEDGKAVIYVPAMRVVMGLKTSLTDLTPEVDQQVLTDNPIAAPEAPERPLTQEEIRAQYEAQGISVGDDSAESGGSEVKSLKEMNLDDSKVD